MIDTKTEIETSALEPNVSAGVKMQVIVHNMDCTPEDYSKAIRRAMSKMVDECDKLVRSHL